MKNITGAILALSLATATVLVAQPPGSDSAPRGRHHGSPGGPARADGRSLSPLFLALDTNKDGVISAAEIANAAISLTALDDNGDGDLSYQELRPMPPVDATTPPAGVHARGLRPRGTTPAMLALDANNDGELSAAEIANAVASLKALDTNGDGKLTRDELRPLPPAGT
jgi:Ca2+-binding EF-hand superfamily protein